METQTSTPTPFPIMILNDSLDYDKDDYASALKRQNDAATYLRRPSATRVISSQPDKKNKLLVRVRRITRRSTFRKSFVSLGVSI